MILCLVSGRYYGNNLTSTEIRIYRDAVLTVLLYGSETWAVLHRVDCCHDPGDSADDMVQVDTL